MIEYKVTYRALAGGNSRLLFVEADTPMAAEAIALDHVRRTYGYASGHVVSVEPYTRPVGGRVVGGEA